MARSHKIYVVRDDFCGDVVACFTVKHECLSFLEGKDSDELKLLYVETYPDGNPYGVILGPTIMWDGRENEELWK